MFKLLVSLQMFALAKYSFMFLFENPENSR